MGTIAPLTHVTCAAVVWLTIAPTTPVSAASPGILKPHNAMTSYPSPILFNPQYQRYVNGVPASSYVITNPQVYLVFWGAQWKNQSLKDSSGVYTNYQAQQLILNFFQALSGAPWVNTLTQYRQGIPGGPNGSYCPNYSSARYITNPTSIVKGWWVDDVDSLPSKVDLNSAQVEAWNAWNIHFFDANAMYLIFTPSGEPWDFFGSCAWHDENDQAPGIAFGVVPYQPDRGQACAGYSVNPVINNQSSGGYGDGYFDGETMAASHEYSEVGTDPHSGGWFETDYNGEIGDKCGLSSRPSVSYLIPVGNLWLGPRYYAIQALWSNADNACVLPFDNSGNMYVLDGYGGIHPSGSAPSLSNSYYAGYDIARGLSLFFGATGGYWLDGFGAIHAVGNALSSAAMQVPSFGSDIARAIWVAPWGTPNHPQGLILDGYGGLHPFWANGDTQPVQPISPHYTNGTDIARDLVINLDQSGSNPISGYMLDGHGTVWPFGNASRSHPPSSPPTWRAGSRFSRSPLPIIRTDTFWTAGVASIRLVELPPLRVTHIGRIGTSPGPLPNGHMPQRRGATAR